MSTSHQQLSEVALQKIRTALAAARGAEVLLSDDLLPRRADAIESAHVLTLAIIDALTVARECVGECTFEQPVISPALRLVQA